MIRERFKNILGLTILIFFRQIWKLLCNLYHLVDDPFLTLKKLKADRDKSQIFLLVLTAIFPFIFYGAARIFWDYYKYGFILNSVGKFFLVTVIIEVFIFSYLSFWLYKIYEKK